MTSNRRRGLLRRRPSQPPTLPPLEFPDAPNPNVRHTLRGLAHPRAPHGNLLHAIVWNYDAFPPPDGHDAFIAEVDALFAEADGVLGDAEPDPDDFFAGYLDGVVEEAADLDLPPGLSGREVLAAYRDMAAHARDRDRG
ncbi:MAG TPA: hypothetical protein VGA69_01805 [Nitriliruptorales bacterium]